MVSMKDKYDLEFLTYESAENPGHSEIAIQTNHLANEQAIANELKKIELRMELNESPITKTKVDLLKELKFID